MKARTEIILMAIPFLIVIVGAIFLFWKVC